MPFAETWMDLETIILSKVSQKEKNKRILTHICEIQKNGRDEPICKAEIETQMQSTNVWTPRKERDGMDLEIGIDIYTLLCIKQMVGEGLLYSTGGGKRNNRDIEQPENKR